jgi:hypothetical protein
MGPPGSDKLIGPARGHRAVGVLSYPGCSIRVVTTDQELPTPRLSLGSVNVDCADPVRLAEFWAAATGGEVSGEHGDFVFVRPPDGGVMLYFQRVQRERPTHNSIHLDFSVPAGQRETEVARLVELGASRQWDVVGEVPWVDWSTMADPEGNLFCVGSPPA